MAKRKNQAQLNREIAELLKRKGAVAHYTVKEIELLQQYAGAGGLGKELSEDEAIRGLLYEYYTPYPIVEKMWAMVFKHGFEHGNILEPSCGTGHFLRYIDPKRNNVTCYEFAKDNTTSIDIARITYPWASFTNDYFESYFYEGNKRVGAAPSFNLVIGNPPYGKFTGFYAGKQREGKHTKATTYDQYFIEKGIELLLPGGLLCMIVPSAFLSNDSSYNEFKNNLAETAELVDAYRLPRSAFEFTQIQTDILLFRKKELTL